MADDMLDEDERYTGECTRCGSWVDTRFPEDCEDCFGEILAALVSGEELDGGDTVVVEEPMSEDEAYKVAAEIMREIMR